MNRSSDFFLPAEAFERATMAARGFEGHPATKCDIFWDDPQITKSKTGIQIPAYHA